MKEPKLKCEECGKERFILLAVKDKTGKIKHICSSCYNKLLKGGKL